MNYLDLFSGCGGFRRGLEEAGFTFEWEGHSEIDKYAKQIYKKHYPESEDLGDVKTIRPDGFPKINLITFGFPCQDLSIAGKRGGLEASRSGLFYEAMRIIRDARPDYFIFENVKGLFSSNGGLDWFNVLREIADSGYDGQWQLLNTRWFLPQNRERIYFVGYPRGRSRPKIFPIGNGSKRFNGKDGKERRQERISSTIDAACGRWRNAGETLIIHNVYGGFNEDKFREFREYSPTIRTPKGGGHIPYAKNKQGIRRLTPTECERLQGFPDGWTAAVSDTQRYKMLGNAVSVPVVKTIMERFDI